MLVTLIEQIAAMRPRCIRVVADAGWGKTAFARTYADAIPERSAIVECRTIESADAFDRAIVQALRTIGVTGDDTAALADPWSAPAPPSTIVIDDARRLLNVEHAIDRLRALLRTIPANRTIVVCSRTELPIVWSSYFQPHEIATVGRAHLAIDAAELEIIFGSIERAPEIDARILAVSHGWPIAVLLLVRLASVGEVESALDRLNDVPLFGDLHEYVQAEIFADLSDEELDVLCLVAGFGEITIKDATLALDYDAEPQLSALSGRMRYLLTRERDTFRAVPLALVAAEKMQRPRISALLLNASDRFAMAGRYVRAAELALRGGNPAKARVALDAAGAPSADFNPSSLYVETALALPIDELARSRNVLAILLGGRLNGAAGIALDARVKARWEHLDAGDPDVVLRTALRIARAMLLQIEGNYADAERSARGAERDIALFEPGAPLVRVLFVTRSLLAANAMLLDDAEAYWARSGEALRPSETYYTIERNYINIMTAIASGSTTAVRAAYADAIAEIDVATHEPNSSQARMYAAAAAIAATGRFPQTPSNTYRAGIHPTARVWRLNVVELINAALKQSERTTAIDFMRTAITNADAFGAVNLRVQTRVIAAALDPLQRARLIDEALALPLPDAYRKRVEEVRDNAVSADSVFAPFVRDVMESAAHGDEPACRLEVMRGKVTRHGNEVRLRPRELELFVSVALATTPLTREQLIDRMWPEQSETEAAGSLRSTMHRLRQQLGQGTFILRDGNRYRLSNELSVDALEAEALYNAVRRNSMPLGSAERRSLERHFASIAHPVPDVYGQWPWFTGVESRLVDLRHGVGMLLARDDFDNGNVSGAIHWTERLIELDPLDEGAAALLYLSLQQTSGKTEATRWMRRYRQLLANEFGLEPSFELERIAGGAASAIA